MEKRIALAQLRRTNLKAWMEKNSISQTDLAKILETTKGYVCGLFMQDKFFGEKIGRKIEEVLSMPRYYLDRVGPAKEATGNWKQPVDLPDGMYGLVPRIDLQMTNQGLQHRPRTLPPLAFTKDWLQKQNVNSFDGLRCWTATDNAMAPAITEGDLVLLDLSQTKIEDGCIYAVQHTNQIRLRRLNQGFGGLILQTDSPNFPDETIAAQQVPSLVVIGRCIYRAG